MKIHHLNCGTLCPAVSRIPGLFPTKLVCHCLLVEGDRGLVLLDTGLGALDGRRMPGFARPLLLGPGKPSPQESAIAQVRRIGFHPEDVRHILVTHLDFDHAGGLLDFPHATVHLYEPELAAALAPARLLEKLRYHPIQWAHAPQWKTHQDTGEKWFGLDGVRLVEGIGVDLGIEAYLIPMVGHTWGHSAYAIRGGEDQWVLHCGDGYVHHGQMCEPPSCPLNLSLFERLIQTDGRARVKNQALIRGVVNANPGKIQVICSHDPMEWERCASAHASESNGRRSEEPISASARQSSRP